MPDDIRRYIRVMISTRELFVHYPEDMTEDQAKQHAIDTANKATDAAWSVPRCDAVLITPDGTADRLRWRPTTTENAYEPPNMQP